VESARQKNVLVVYAAFPTRATLLDALYSFRRYAAGRIYYLNLRLKKIPWYIRKTKFDLIVFHTLFFSGRYDSAAFRRLMRKASPLADMDAVKVILPQDEFINAKVVNEFINAFDINVVFSVQPEHEWPAIYKMIDRTRCHIHRVLPGYLDDFRLKKMQKYMNSSGKRPIDIGYRTTGNPYPWFGRHGYLKKQIADIFAPKAKEQGLNVDISTSAADTLLGDDWYRFLCVCKYTLGVEGGTSILDYDGSIKERTEQFCRANPNATFEDIEKACFPGLDGQFHGYAISPRHLEACAAKVCQVLTEGEYNGILHPGKHYIPVKQKFTNVDEVLEKIKEDDLRNEITETAYRDIVLSGNYNYRRFVEMVMSKSLCNSGESILDGFLKKTWRSVIYRWMMFMDYADRLIGEFHGRALTPLRQRFIGR
jgi:hypothetical protein